MRLSALLGKTHREAPADAHLASHQLLVRAGYVRTVDVGLFGYLPLGVRCLHRLRTLVRRELEVAGGQEVALPPVAGEAPLATLLGLARREIDSYRQLPLVAFRFETLSSPQARVRSGPFGAVERPAVAVHVFHGAEAAGPQQPVAAAVERVLAACAVPAVWAEAGAGEGRAFLPHEAGDQDLVRCPGCGYAAERSWAAPAWPPAPEGVDLLPPQDIETPGCNTIAALAEFLDISPAQTLKMVFYSVEGKVTCVVVRGDRSVDEAKLARVLGTSWYYPSLEDELARIGAVGGYASPIGLDPARVRVVADPSVRSGRNFVSGANRPDYHIRNVNVPRDFEPGEWVDLALVEAGDPCPRCGTALAVEPAFALIAHTAPALCQPEVEYLDQEGCGQPLWLASWHLDLGRLLAAVVEEHHDEHGILWPAALAPFAVHLLALDLKREAVAAQAEALYARLLAAGLSVLYDDRDASAGVKFNDADLIGLPLRLTVSKRSEQEGLIEAKWRHQADRLKLDEQGLAAELDRLRELGQLPIFPRP